MKRAASAVTFAIAFVAACGSFDAAPDPGTPATGDGGSDAPATDGGERDAGRAPIKFVQVNATESPAGQATATVSLNPFTAHHSVILAVAVLGSATVTKVTDTLGGGFAQIVGPSSRPNGDAISVWFAADVPMGGEEKITVTASAIGSRMLVYAHEYANITAFDIGLGGNGSTPGAISSPTITTSTPGELLFGFAISALANEGVGFTVRSKFDANVTEDRIVDVPGETSATAIVDQSWVIIGAAFK